MKIVVLAGGLSPERDVSLSSGCLIANALLDAGHAVVMTDVYTGIRGQQSPQALAALFRQAPAPKYSYAVPAQAPDLAALRAAQGQRALIGPGVLALCAQADAVFIGLHGAMGENGQIQAVFDVFDICYTGSGFEGCLLAMNKDLSKRLLRAQGVPVPEGILVDTARPEALGSLRFPCFVKPCSGGSSLGTSRVEDASELGRAIAYAQAYETTVLIENEVKGREFSVGILDGRALPPIEIIPQGGFYDYQRKYQAGTLEVCPAELPEALTRKAQERALQVYGILGLRDYARMDFILNEEGEFVCLEANTLPGMTPTSLLPQEALAAGIPYVELCQKIVEMALKRRA